jgi:dihydroorotate dehydrogenase
VVKIAPDLSESELLDIASVIRENEVDGVIVSNTTVSRPSSLMNGMYFPYTCRIISLKRRAVNKREQGGLSGRPLKPYTLAALRILRPQIPASVPLIGCGGISTGADALEYAKAGASLVQIYTSFGYDGPGACRRIKDEVNDILAKEGTTWQGVVDKAVNALSWRPSPPPVPVKPEELSEVQVLINEAKELRHLLDRLSEKFGGGDTIGTL